MSVVLDYLNGVLRLHSSTKDKHGRVGEQYYKWILRTGRLLTEKEDNGRFQVTFETMFKGCYYNAQFMAIEYDKLKYYEGWGVTEKIGIPLEHGFNVIGDKVVDVTWSDGIEYFGIEVPVDFAREEMLKEKTAHSILFSWWEETERRK